MLKKCPKCGEEKAADAFNLDRSRRSGLSSYCKDCTRERVRKWMASPKGKATTAAWREKNPDKWKGKRNPETRAAYEERHRERINAYAREWKRKDYAKNPGKWIDKSHRRRAAVAGLKVVEPVDRMAIYERDGGRCHICGKKCRKDAFDLDHLIPIAWSDVSEHTARNLRVAHRSCNAKMNVAKRPAQLLLIG